MGPIAGNRMRAGGLRKRAARPRMRVSAASLFGGEFRRVGGDVPKLAAKLRKLGGEVGSLAEKCASLAENCGAWRSRQRAPHAPRSAAGGRAEPGHGGRAAIARARGGRPLQPQRFGVSNRPVFERQPCKVQVDIRVERSTTCFRFRNPRPCAIRRGFEW